MLIAFIGPAGTGKTTALVDWAASQSDRLTSPRQRLLALSFMHGSRKRLIERLRERNIPAEVTTIDSIALDLVNRWRTSLGIAGGIRSGATEQSLRACPDGLRCGFNKVLEMACQVLTSATVVRWFASTYPVVIVDEFQDCDAIKTRFVSALQSAPIALAIAADDFQVLNDAPTPAPALQWLDSLKESNAVDFRFLDEPHRFLDEGVLAAATAIRSGVPVTQTAITFHFCPSAPLAGSRLLTFFTGAPLGRRRDDSWAVIAPSRDAVFRKVLAWSQDKATERWGRAIPWQVDVSEEAAVQQVLEDLANSTDHSAQLREMSQSIDRYCSMRGLQRTPDVVLDRVRHYVHVRRTHGPDFTKRIVCSVHGAKNREFDHVSIVWTPSVRGSFDYQRRLLYNAVTRAKKRCIVLAIGRKEVVLGDPVLLLLGPPQQPVARRSRTRARRG